MGTGTYGHARRIVLHGPEKGKATRAKKKREKRIAEVTAADLAKEHLSHRQTICPACWRPISPGRTCAHHHPEDREVFEIEPIEVEFLLVEPGTAKRLHDEAKED